MNSDLVADDGKHACETEGCSRLCGRHDVICSRCMDAVARMCRGKQRVNPYVARMRAERTGRGSYRCLVCNCHHNTRSPSGPGADIVRARVKRAVKALITHRGKTWFTKLVQSWNPANGADPRAGRLKNTASA